MVALSFIFGILLFILGVITLPTPPADQELVKASGALTGFFFGGWLIICGIFIKKYGRHGKVGLGMIAICGLCFALYKIGSNMTKQQALEAPLINGVLLITSLILTVVTFTAWRKSRGVRAA
ncbi:hypothetical protein N9192_00885 [Akkermansiaceae bacterium]|nr:hypothetical protein [Akkermansiaceae bacterium]MDB4541429.1 hypothetical protein [Akkermansiaceae bacterium]